MTNFRQLGRSLKKIVYGDTFVPQEFTVALRQPQAEVAVFLHGLGAPIEVTERHTIACCAPFIIGVCLPRARFDGANKCGDISLRFHERLGQQQVLGIIRLEPKAVIPLDESELLLFNVLDSRNYCLPKHRLWAHYVPAAIANWRKLRIFDVKMSYREIRASQVAFIRPHPLVLGSVHSDGGGNIFPMNLMGDLGGGRFAFALKGSRRAAHLVERAGCIVLSSVPMPLCSIAIQLAINHTKDSIDWSQLPFLLSRSRELRVPFPASSPRVREMKVDQVHKIGSHTLFLARILSDEHRSDAPQVHMIHGFYQLWRLRGDKAKLRSSLVEDAFNKHGAALT
jgi:flavin reductase (DIM6/NTAB) family NADH-FMN oxidoreductase RutF